MNTITVIEVNSTGFGKLLSVCIYSQIVPPQLEYGLVLSAVNTRNSRSSDFVKIDVCVGYFGKLTLVYKSYFI